MTNVLIAENSILKNPPVSQHAALNLAIEELDLFISELINAGSMSISPSFLDWVADTLTPKIEAKLLVSHQSTRFAETLRLDNPRVVLAHWVRHWACMEIKQKFAQYAKFCPCAKPSSQRCAAGPVAPTMAATPGT